MIMIMMMHLRCSPASRFGCAINRQKLNLVSNSMQQLNEKKLLASSKFAMEQHWGNDIGCLRKKFLSEFAAMQHWGFRDIGCLRKKFLSRVCCNATLGF
jgi:hypothetical protein